MSSYVKAHIYAYKAKEDLSAKQFHGLKFDESLVEAAAAQEGVAILMSATEEGLPAEVALPGGGAKVKLAGSVSAGDSLTTNADGALVAASAGERAIAVALEDGVSGDVIDAVVQIHSVPAA